MRKLFWCSMAVAAAVTASLISMAFYAHSHPQSLAGRVVENAWSLAIQIDPVLHVGQYVGQKSMNMGKAARAAAPIAARPCCREVPEKPACVPVVSEVIDLSRLIDVKEMTEGEASEPPCPEEMPAKAPVKVETVGPDGIEEEVKQPVEESSENIKGLIREISEVILEEEYKGAEVLPMPREEEVATVPTEEVLPQPREQGTEEQSDSINEGAAPTNRVDPLGHEDYPSCPRMEGCPASRSCPASVCPAQKQEDKKMDPEI